MKPVLLSQTLLLVAAMTIAAQAQTFTTLVTFEGANGASPAYVSLIQGIDGSLYGTTSTAGANIQGGTVFRLTLGGVLTTLYSFCAMPNCADGSSPTAGLVLGRDGNLYGTTTGGGAYGVGSVFKITSAGMLTTLHSFCVHCGNTPFAGLIQATDGNFYGTTYFGGGGGCMNGCGTIFRISPEGKFTEVLGFGESSGGFPVAPLIQATNGDLYGTTSKYGEIGGVVGLGTVYSIDGVGDPNVLYVFCIMYCGDGATPIAGLFQAADGTLYGTTAGDGGYGTVFEVGELGGLSTLYSFCSLQDCADGAYPYAPVIQATDGNLYGTTTRGGSDYGTVFELTADGELHTLYTFCSQTNCSDGTQPYGGLLQATDGNFYGTTYYGSTLFRLDTGLGPFVSFVGNPAKVGQKFGIIGQGFTGTTSVSLNGTPASFAVVSDTFIKATVPAGATTGYVTVTTPSGTLTSNVPFRVLP